MIMIVSLNLCVNYNATRTVPTVDAGAVAEEGERIMVAEVLRHFLMSCQYKIMLLLHRSYREHHLFNIRDGK